MSVTERAETGVALDDLPEFDLSYLFDDRDDPSKVTVFPDSNDRDISTNWITIDTDHATSIENAR